MKNICNLPADHMGEEEDMMDQAEIQEQDPQNSNSNAYEEEEEQQDYSSGYHQDTQVKLLIVIFRMCMS
jgi:hypothetical protein